MQLYRGLLIGVLLTAAACSKTTETESTPATDPITVAIGADPRVGIDVESRTQIDEEGAEVRWSETDQIALWAETADASFAFEGAEFALWHYSPSWQSALFRGDIPPMEQSPKYTYYAVSPVPAAVNSGSREVSFEIPAVQDGTFHGEWDVMVADPVSNAPALVAGDNSAAVTMKFHHQVHLLRIRIPGNQLGEAITQLTLTFPTDVTGTMTVDITDPQAQPRISGSQSVTLQFAEPKNVGDVVFATIAPVTLQETDQIEIVATGSLYESEARSMAGKDFRPGHTTPIAYTVPQAGKILGTMLRLSLHDTGVNTLGEAIQRLWVAADGVTFEMGSAENPFTVNAEGQYEILLPNGSEIPGLLNAAGALTVYYDSEHATVTKTCALPTINTQAVNDITLPDVPYLFEEDFSGVNGQGHDDDKGTGNGSGYALDDINLPGWSGQRIGSDANAQSVRINSRHEGAWSINAYYNGRITSAPLAGLKSAADAVSVKIEYMTGGSYSGDASADIYCQFGTTTNTGNVIYSDEDMTNIGEQMTIAAGCSYSNIPYKIESTFNATKETRLSWKVSNNDSNAPFLGSYTTYYVYLDDIRVSIVNQ